MNSVIIKQTITTADGPKMQQPGTDIGCYL